MSVIDKAKRDFKKHPAKAGVLGVLFIVMIFFGIKAALDLKPNAVAAAPAPEAPAIHASTVISTATDAQERLAESLRLWDVLLQAKPSAIPTEVAFSFDANYFDLDLTQQQRVIVPQADPGPATPIAPAPVPVSVNTEGLKIARIREGAKTLIIKSILVGNNTSKPVAIINQQLLTIGHEIQGYVITAIRSREVELIKEGVTVVVKMPDELRGQ